MARGGSHQNDPFARLHRADPVPDEHAVERESIQRLPGELFHPRQSQRLVMRKFERLYVLTRPHLAEKAGDPARMIVRCIERGQGLARRLMALVEAQAEATNAAVIDLWTDIRFTTAHGFYESLGYQRRPGTRRLKDASSSIEINYVKQLRAP